MKAVFVGGRFNGEERDVQELWAYANGKSSDWSIERLRGGIVPRKELDNQPLIPGYLSPMWDGGKLRYETQEVYDMLSR